MPTVFASVSVTVMLLYLTTLILAHAHFFPVELHMLWGLFTSILIILLQCLIFGFFIGSGKSIKTKVQELGLDSQWVQKTKDYKKQSYPALMLAILFSVTAAILGGGVSRGTLPVWLHAGFMWAAFFLNLRSLWISYRVIVENVEGIHQMNREIRSLETGKAAPVPVEVSSPLESRGMPAARRNVAANFYFVAVVIWVPYLYIRFSLGSRTFSFWPFLILSGLLGVMGWLKSKAKPT